jgi:hypothetical protein
VAAWIALIEVAIGEAQARDRSAKASLIDFLHCEARRDRKAEQMGANRSAVHSDRPRRQIRKALLTIAHLDSSNNVAIRKYATPACGPIEARILE